MDENHVKQIDQNVTRRRSGSMKMLERSNRLPEADLRADFKSRTEEDKKKANIAAGLPIEVPASYIDSAGFATAFNTQVSAGKRSFKQSVKSSRLYKKAQCASRMKAVMQQILPLKEVSLDEFLAIDVSNLRLGTDEEFVESAPRLRDIKGISRVMEYIIPEKLQEDRTISEEKKARINQKLELLTRLVGYYDARSALITNEYYMTHYNSELTYMEKRKNQKAIDPKHDRRTKIEKEFDKKIVKQEEVSNLIIGVEYASFLLKNGSRPNEENRELFNQLYNKRLSEKKRLSVIDSFSTRSRQESTPSSGMGYFLQFMNWMTRRKRRTTYGEAEYDTAVRKMGQLPQEIRNYKQGVPILKKKGMAPDIDLSKYMQDSVKDSLKHMHTLAPVPTEEDGDYKLAHEAMGYWTGVRGIVNLDTVRMEMAFSDRFLKASRRWLTAHPEAEHAEDVLLKARFHFLAEANRTIEENMYGRLKGSMSNEEFDYIVKKAPVISEDNTYGENVEESNTKDIPLFLHKPNINDIKQAFVGNCWLQASLSAIVAQNPDVIENMFCDLKDGSVMVRLFRIKDKNGGMATDLNFAYDHKDEFTAEPMYFRIRKDFEEENGNANDCLWAQILERAVAASGATGHFLAKVKDGKLTDMAAELTEGDIPMAYALLTGQLWNEVTVETKEKKTEQAEAGWNDLAKYYYYLSGLPRDLKDYIAVALGEMESDNKKIDLKTIIEIAKQQQEVYKLEHETLLALYDQVSQMGDVLERTGKLKDLDRFELYRDQIGLAMGITYAEQDVEELIRKNAEQIKTGFTPKLKAGDQNEFKGIAADLRTLLCFLKAEIPNNMQGDIVKHANELFKRITDTANVGGMKGNSLKDYFKESDKNRFEGDNFKESDAFLGNMRTAFRLEYGKTNYTEKQEKNLIHMLVNLKRNGPFSVGLGRHCMTVMDIRKQGEHWYFLIRDPFNLYNHSYTEKDGEVSLKKSEGFFRVFNYNLYHRKRHLTDRGDASNMRAGFRGLSWWTYEDVCKEIGMFAVK